MVFLSCWVAIQLTRGRFLPKGWDLGRVKFAKHGIPQVNKDFLIYLPKQKKLGLLCSVKYLSLHPTNQNSGFAPVDIYTCNVVFFTWKENEIFILKLWFTIYPVLYCLLMNQNMFKLQIENNFFFILCMHLDIFSGTYLFYNIIPVKWFKLH